MLYAKILPRSRRCCLTPTSSATDTAFGSVSPSRTLHGPQVVRKSPYVIRLHAVSRRYTTLRECWVTKKTLCCVRGHVNRMHFL